MTAKQQALKDIHNDLREQGKAFIAYHRELNQVMRQLVSDHLKQQKKKDKGLFPTTLRNYRHIAKCFLTKAGKPILKSYDR